MNCSLLAYTESSLDIIWLVDYNHHSTMANGPQQISPQQSSSSAEIQSPSLSTSSLLFELPHNGQRPPLLPGRHSSNSNIGRLPAEERFIVLYDSKLHRSNNTTATATATTNNNNAGLGGNQPSRMSSSHEEEDSSSSSSGAAQEFVWNEASLYGSRILIRETRPSVRNGHEFIFKESQIIIQSAQMDDSAR